MLEPLLDEHALDHLALGTGLVGDQRMPIISRPPSRAASGALDDLDAAALAAAAGVNLRLDDHRSAAEAARRLPAPRRRERRLRPAAPARRVPRGSPWPDIRGSS